MWSEDTPRGYSTLRWTSCQAPVLTLTRHRRTRRIVWTRAETASRARLAAQAPVGPPAADRAIALSSSSARTAHGRLRNHSLLYLLHGHLLHGIGADGALQDYANGFELGINPVLVQIGPATLRWFGLMVAIGLTAGLFVSLREARRKGFADEAVYGGALWALLAGVALGRAFHVVDKLDFYLQNPHTLPALNPGAMAVWGGVLGGALGIALYAKREGLPALRLLDAATPGALVGLIVGRVGSLVNGEAWGAPSDLPWALVYTHPEARLPVASIGIPTHPYPAYEMLWCLLTLGVLWRARARVRVDGLIFVGFLLFYSAGRLVLTTVREEGVFALGMQQAQLVALLVFLIALPALVYILTGSRSGGGGAVAAGRTVDGEARAGQTPLTPPAR